MANPPSVEQLSTEISNILDTEDLASLSSKKVRMALQEKFESDLTTEKQLIDDILMKLINERQAQEAEKANDSDSSDGKEEEKAHPSNGYKASKNAGSSSDDSDVNDKEVAPKAKKPRLAAKPSTSKAKSANKVEDDSDSSDGELDDAAVARKLQAQELGMRPRARRAAAASSTKKTKEKGEKKPRRSGNSAYSQECVLSEDLAALVGAERMARKDVVSAMWKIFKDRDILDPKNRQYVLCDEELERIFKVKKFKAFGMMKILKHHIKDPRLIHT